MLLVLHKVRLDSILWLVKKKKPHGSYAEQQWSTSTSWASNQVNLNNSPDYNFNCLWGQRVKFVVLPWIIITQGENYTAMLEKVIEPRSVTNPSLQVGICSCLTPGYNSTLGNQSDQHVSLTASSMKEKASKSHSYSVHIRSLFRGNDYSS